MLFAFCTSYVLFFLLSLSFGCPAVYAVTVADLLSDALIHSLCFQFMLLLKGLFAVYASRCSLRGLFTVYHSEYSFVEDFFFVFLPLIQFLFQDSAFGEGLKFLSLPA